MKFLAEAHISLEMVAMLRGLGNAPGNPHHHTPPIAPRH